jgi:hypothetical protein
LQPSSEINAPRSSTDVDLPHQVQLSKDIKGLNALSVQIVQRGKQQPRVEITDTIALTDDDELVEDAKRLLGLFEAELATYPDDPRVAQGLQNHLVRMAEIMISYLHPSEHWKDRPQSVLYSKSQAATEACTYLMQARAISPTARIATNLSIVFSMAKYFGTALHWIDEAEALAEAAGNEKHLNTLKAGRLQLKSEGNTNDRSLAPQSDFPKPDTPGLQLQLQPALAPPNLTPLHLTPTTGPIYPLPHA